jgi:hypothetical protein
METNRASVTKDKIASFSSIAKPWGKQQFDERLGEVEVNAKACNDSS